MLIEFNGKKPRVSPKAFVAPTATLIGDVEVSPLASIWFGAVLRGDLDKITIGMGSSVQDNTVIHADRGKAVVVAENVTVGHGAVLHACTVKKGAVIGANAVVLDKAIVGEEAMVAAGSVVTPGTHIPARHLATGVPARVKKAIAGDSLQQVEQGAFDYQELTRSYLQQRMGEAGQRPDTNTRPSA